MELKEKIRELYDLCFFDTSTFVDYFFALNYSKDKILYKTESDKIIAELFFVKKSGSFFNQNINLEFISAVCTHPDYRERGVMTELMKDALIKAASENIEILALHPFNDSYYTKFGFAGILQYEKRIVRFNKALDLDIREADKNDAALLTEIYQNMTSHYDFFISRDITAMKNKIEETFSDGGKVYIISKKSDINPNDTTQGNGNATESSYLFNPAIKNIMPLNELSKEILGYVMVDSTKIDEVVFTFNNINGEDEYVDYLEKILSGFKEFDRLVFDGLSVNKGIADFIQVRIVNVLKMLNAYKRSAEIFPHTFFIEDNLITPNTGNYEFKKTDGVWRQVSGFETENKSVIRYNINEFNKRFFEGIRTVMYDKY